MIQVLKSKGYSMISTIKLSKDSKIVVTKADDDFHINIEIFAQLKPLCYFQMSPDQAGALISAIEFASSETPTV
jgi:hypothetical protein